MNRFKPWPALLILLLTQGCGGILTSDQPARQHYLLQPLDAASAGPGEADLALQVTAIPGLDTDQVLALGTDARLQQVSNARWTDHLPEVLTSTLQRSLESSGRFAAVQATDRAMADGWQLQLEAREFFGILDAAGNTSSVRVALAGSLECHGQRHALNLRDSNPVGAQRLASVVAAHQAGLDDVTRQLTRLIGELCPPETSE